MKELPPGWEWTTLGGVLTFHYGKGLVSGSRRHGTVPIMGSSGVVGTHDSALTERACIVIGRKGSAGSVYWCPEPCWPVDTVYFAYAPDRVSPQFLYHLLLHLQLRKLDSSTAVPSLLRQDLEAVSVPFPPWEEQRRIVAEVEKQMSRLDLATVSLRTIEAKLAAASRSILQKTCEHSDPLATGSCVGDVSECLDRQRIPVNAEERKRRGGSVPYFGANGQVGWIDKPIFNEPLILVVEDETFVGRTKPFAYRIEGPSWVNNHAHVLRPNANISLRYLHNALMYYPFTPLTTGSTGRRKLTQNALMAAPLCLPKPEEQHRRVESLDRWFSIADQLGQTIDSATQRAARLRQAILHKAFAGKLVPQDPNDEPASVLLERIRATRAQTPARRAPRKREVHA